MKKLLLALTATLAVVACVYLGAQPIGPGPIGSFGSGVSSNTVYTMIVAFGVNPTGGVSQAGVVLIGDTNWIRQAFGTGTSNTLSYALLDKIATTTNLLVGRVSEGGRIDFLDPVDGVSKYTIEPLDGTLALEAPIIDLAGVGGGSTWVDIIGLLTADAINLEFGTNLPFSGLSEAARTAITNILSSGSVPISGVVWTNGTALYYLSGTQIGLQFQDGKAIWRRNLSTGSTFLDDANGNARFAISPTTSVVYGPNLTNHITITDSNVWVQGYWAGNAAGMSNAVALTSSGATVTITSPDNGRTFNLESSATGGSGQTGMKTNTFTTFYDGQWQLFTNIPDGSLCFSNLTYPQFVLMLRTNGSLLLTNSTTGSSNVMSAAGWVMNKGQTNFENSVVIKNLAIGGNDTLANTVANLGSAALSVIVPGGSGNQYLIGYGANGDCYYTAGTAGAHIFRMAGSTKTKLHNSGGLSLGNTTDPGANNLNVSGNITATNGYYGRSNVVFHVPTNAPTDGQVVTASGTTGITRWANATGGGTGIATNSGSGIDNTLTNTVLRDSNGIDTWRPNREVVNSSGNVVADFDARNLNGTGGNALNWSADGTLVRVFNDFQIDGKLTTPAALVSNTPAADEVIQYTSATTAKSTSDLTLTSLNVTTINGNGRGITNVNADALFYNTNAVANVTLIDLTKRYGHTNHTANFTITGFTTGTVDPGGTNYQFATRCYTNNSVGAKTITLPASWIDIGVKGNPVYNTNIGVLSVWVIPNFATNYAWAGR